MSKTLQLLVASSFKNGKSGLGVLTTEQAQSRYYDNGRDLVTISSLKHNVFFFSDDHIFGYKILPESFVPCSGGFPVMVKPCTNVPNGAIDTLEKYIDYFHKNKRQITTIEELANFIDDLAEVETVQNDGGSTKVNHF